MLRGASLWQISGTKGEEWHGLYMRLGLPRKSYGYNPIGLQDSQQWQRQGDGGLD